MHDSTRIPALIRAMTKISRKDTWRAVTIVVFSLAGCQEANTNEGRDGDLGHGYSRKGGHILFEGQRIDQAGRQDIDRFAKAVGHPLVLCKNVDAPTFVPLSEEYSKDKNTVYYKWVSPGPFWVVELVGADPATFAVLDFNLAKDGKQVWKGDRVIEGADPTTARVIHPHWTWKDRNRVYYQSTVILGADPDTFRHLAQGFYRDSKRAYWCDEPLPDADPETLVAFGDDIPYARDRQRVWSGKTVLDGVEAKSFEHMHDHVYKDARGVYVGTTAHEVLRADSASFAKVARLGPGETALFRDRHRHYVYDPTYSEVYALDRSGNGLLISKPVWLSQAGARKPAHGATVSARLKDGVLSEPEVVLEPAFKKEKLPIWETDKLKRLAPVFVDAQRRIQSASDSGHARHWPPSQ